MVEGHIFERNIRIPREFMKNMETRNSVYCKQFARLQAVRTEIKWETTILLIFDGAHLIHIISSLCMVMMIIKKQRLTKELVLSK